MSGGPPLFVACETNNLELLTESLKTSLVDTRSPNQSFTPLMVAANRGAIDLVNHLISVGANINAQSEGGFTALILAIISYNDILAIKKIENDNSNPSLSVIKRLVESGADVNIVTDGGNTALQEAALQGNLEIANLLLSKGANVNFTNKWNENALMASCFKNGIPEVAQALIDAGADVSANDVDGNSALDLATRSENFAVAELLKRFV